MSPFIISPAATPQDLTDTFALLEEYSASLNIDLTFQDISTEKATWPGKYQPSRGGALLIARRRPTSTTTTTDGQVAVGEAIGCVALRSLGRNDNDDEHKTAKSKKSYCEMKRLYVRPSARGLGVGRALAEAIIIEAKRMECFRAMRLDTLPEMRAARRMYESLGFGEIEGYYCSEIAGTVFLELDLGGEG